MEKEYSQKYLPLNRDKPIIFDARELPFFRVAPELSDLGINPRFEGELRQRYPNLFFIRGCVVDGALLINDLLAYTSTFDFDTADAFFTMARDLNKISAITLQVVDGRLVNDYLVQILDNTQLKARNPLVVFPGEGASVVREYIRRQERSVYEYYDMKNAVSLPCKRAMREKGKFDIAVDYSSLPNTLKTDMVLIIDDVIASGQTVQTVAQELKRRYGKVFVMAASWFFLRPTIRDNKEAPSGIKEIDAVFASFALKGNYVARPPINSLSCFIRNEVKYNQVKNDFMQKYITDKDMFQRILEEMRR